MNLLWFRSSPGRPKRLACFCMVMLSADKLFLRDGAIGVTGKKGEGC